MIEIVAIVLWAVWTFVGIVATIHMLHHVFTGLCAALVARLLFSEPWPRACGWGVLFVFVPMVLHVIWIAIGGE